MNKKKIVVLVELTLQVRRYKIKNKIKIISDHDNCYEEIKQLSG